MTKLLQNLRVLMLAAASVSGCSSASDGPSAEPGGGAAGASAGSGPSSGGSPNGGSSSGSSAGASAPGGSAGGSPSHGGALAGTSPGGGNAGGVISSAGASADAGAATAGARTMGGDSNAAGASAGGGTQFESPCPTDGTACKIMPLGDSITESRQQDTGYPGGYRVQLFHLALAAGQKITFVGSSAHGPNGPATVDGVAFPGAHEGHSGYNIDVTGNSWGLYPTFTQNIPTYKPHIILLMIGTNDINNNVQVSEAPTRLGHLIQVLTDENPKALLVVAQIVPTKTEATNVKVRAYNAAIPGVVKLAVDQGRRVLLVDMYTPFVANNDYAAAYMKDDLHPKEAGLALMGNVWYEKLKGVLR